jgi:glycosyltransferase involved in cell wall biosynthesis
MPPAVPPLSVVLTTYNQPRALELVLWGYAVQTDRDFQVVVADDGSGPETGEVVRRLRAETGLELLHVWHEDRGFRKTEILNRAIVAAGGRYLVFTDGDCIPRADFVEAHRRLARPERFLSGGYLKLPAALSGAVSPDDVRAGRATDAAWLRGHGWRPGRRALRLLPPGPLPRALDALTPTRASWNGHNASTWRDLLLAVNGFDADMGYGAEDRALGERLANLGVRGVQVRHRAPCVHLEHPRPYADPEIVRRNRARLRELRRLGAVRAEHGIAELAP